MCFDVDSTVCVDEGIDELAEFCGAGKAVAEWTAKSAVLTSNYSIFWLLRVVLPDFYLEFFRAMSGSVPFEDALAARLSLFNPSLSQVQEFLEKRPPRYEDFFFPISKEGILQILVINICKCKKKWGYKLLLRAQ